MYNYYDYHFTTYLLFCQLQLMNLYGICIACEKRMIALDKT